MTEGHLTDEQLSSHLDEDAAIDVHETAASSNREHLAGCAPCRQRLATLGAVRDRLGMPVPPLSAELRAASIATVLRRAGADTPNADASVAAAAVDVGATGAGATGAGATGAGGTGAGGTGIDTSARGPGAHREPIRIPRRRPQVLVGAAAAALVLVALVSIPLALSGQSTSSSTASAPNAAAKSIPGPGGTDHRAGASGAKSFSANATATVPGLGNVSSLDVLRSRVASVVSERSPTAAPAPQGVSNSASAPSANSATNATSATSAAGEASEGEGLYKVEPGQGTPSQFERCLSSAMHAAGHARTLKFLAVASFRGTPALVYLFSPSSGGSSTAQAAQSAVVATARDGCKVFGTTYLSLGGGG